MADADVSVVIPFFDAADCIGRCLRSVALQSLRVREIIVVDDASAIAFKDLPSLPPAGDLVTVIRFARNQGAAAARNAGVARAKGKYIAFLDSDDVWMPEKIAVQYALMEAGGWALSGHGYSFLPRPDDRRTADIPRMRAVARREFMVTNPFFTPTVMALREGFKPFDESFRRADDYKAWLKNLHTGRTFLINRVLAHGFKQPIGESGLTRSVSAMHLGFMQVISSLYREGEVSLPFYLTTACIECAKLPLRHLRVALSRTRA